MNVLKATFDKLFALLSGRENACGTKHQYGSPVLATKAAYNLETKRKGEVFDVYKCPFCEFYHIGHAVDPNIMGFTIVKTKEEESPNADMLS